MTISASYEPNQDNGNGTTVIFAVNFPFGAPGDLVVELYDTVALADVMPQPVLNGGGTYDYVVSGTPDANTGIYPNGSITFNNAPLSNHEIVRSRATPQLQQTVLTNNAPFPAKTVEGTFDRQEMQLQERSEEYGRALKLAITDPPGEKNATLPGLVGNANAALLVNPSEDGFVFGSIAGSTAEAAAYAAAAAASATIATGVAGPTPEMYGATGNAVIGESGAISTSANRDFSDANVIFTNADIGKAIGIMGAGAAGATLITTIASLGATHHVNLTASCSTSVTNAHYVYGTDDHVALAAFFGANVGKAGALETGSSYLSTVALSCQMRLLDCRFRPIIFLIGNNTSNCFSMIPPVALVNSQITSRYRYKDMFLDGMATGLDLLYCKDGSPNLPGLILANSYRDAFLIQPDGTGTPITAVENLVGSDWGFYNCGRHGLHLYLLCKNDTSVQTYINESKIDSWEIRWLGKRFGSGGAGSANAANAIRITYDNCVVNLTENKISTFVVTGANFDAMQNASLSGSAVGDVIFHNAINGTTNRRVEQFKFFPGGIESSDGTLISGSMIVTGSAMANGDWIDSRIEQGIPYMWGLSGINTALISSFVDGNTWRSNNPTQGADMPTPIVKRPSSGFSLISADNAPNGGIIDYRFKNSQAMFLNAQPLVASGTVNIDIPIQTLAAGAFDYIQWPLTVKISHSPYFNDPTKWSYANYTVFLSWDQEGLGAHLASILEASKVGADLTFTFTPSTGVAFSLQSSSGTRNDILRVTVTGGSACGTDGSNTDCMVCASRWGMGTSEIQRVSGGTPSISQFAARV